MVFQELVNLHWPKPGVRLASMRGSLIASIEKTLSKSGSTCEKKVMTAVQIKAR